jgi:hypothetical protein
LGGYLGGIFRGIFGGYLGGYHALAESLLSRVFSWDVVDVGFPTCLTFHHRFGNCLGIF